MGCDRKPFICTADVALAAHISDASQELFAEPVFPQCCEQVVVGNPIKGLFEVNR